MEMKPAKQSTQRPWTWSLLALGLLMLAVGCTADDPTGEPAFSDRQRRALDDPFGYSAFDQSDDRYNVSNESSQGMKKDLDHVLNP